MGGERDEERRAAGLPTADGPLVRVRLHDGQELYAVVKGRRKERDGTWWYRCQIHLPAAAEQRGRLVDEPAPIDFTAPAGRCEPIAGQAYDTVPTARHGEFSRVPWLVPPRALVSSLQSRS
ncbi:hypothetical protein ABZ721_40320 [Streptomyces sp. NPDC006733]|uniref:hypothetical protein n=1 Tax=Streptomyces sp. NPDC006733 TaxID=3155460 RepID=UPI0033EB91AA